MFIDLQPIIFTIYFSRMRRILRLFEKTEAQWLKGDVQGPCRLNQWKTAVKENGVLKKRGAQQRQRCKVTATSLDYPAHHAHCCLSEGLWGFLCKADSLLSQSKKKDDCIFAKLLFKWNECFKSSFCVVIGLLPGGKKIFKLKTGKLTHP